jgi:protein-S-isoprenylcysteine O-methyltransferase Ste14
MSEPPKIDHAGVWLPPPLIYVAGFGAGWLAERWRSFPITDGPSTARELAGIVAVLLWLALFLSAFTSFRRAHTTLIPNKPASAFVTSGVYNMTRNPMYLSLVALYVGLLLLMNSWWPAVFLPLVILVTDRFVIAREERYLASTFGNEYDDYRRRVRRWI